MKVLINETRRKDRKTKKELIFNMKKSGRGSEQNIRG